MHHTQEESPAHHFMETEGNNAEKAALHLTTHWKFRKDLFADWWLLPLNQTGSGALFAEDIIMLCQGHFVSVTQLTENQWQSLI